MPEMDFFHSAILEGHWMGLNATEIAEMTGDDPMIIAQIIDTFTQAGL